MDERTEVLCAGCLRISILCCFSIWAESILARSLRSSDHLVNLVTKEHPDGVLMKDEYISRFAPKLAPLVNVIKSC